MFDPTKVDRTAGKGFLVMDPGVYPARVEEAKQVSSDYGEQLEVSFKVKYHGRYLPFRQWLDYESADGEATPRVMVGRRVIMELAEACSSLDKRGRPSPKGMPGNLVDLTISRFIRKKGPKAGQEANGLEAVAVQGQGEGQVAPKADAPADPPKGRYDEQEPGPDPDDDLPF